MRRRDATFALSALLAAASVLTACSGPQRSVDADTEAAVPGQPEAAPSSAQLARRSAPTELASGPTPAPASEPTAAPAPVRTVSVEMDLWGSPSTLTGVAVPGDGVTEPIDPFGTFAACSGLRDTVGNWALQISDPAAEVTALSLMTSPAVTGPGPVDGVLRVEFANGQALDATAAITLDPGLQSGSFQALDADWRGTFRCTGTDAPEPDTESDVKVFALLRRGSAERIISVAEPGPVSCAAGVDVTGDAGVGVPVGFSVGEGQLAISFGAVEMALDPASTATALADGAGTFRTVTTDGLEIDGAYSCY